MQYLSASLFAIGVLSSIVSAEPAAEARELGKKHGGHGGYVQPRPIIIAAPQKKGSYMPAPVGKKGGYGGYGGYGMGGYGGYGGYGGRGRWLQEGEEEIEALDIAEGAADARELGKKKHGHGGGYGYHQPIVVAMPQKKQAFIPQPTKKGSYGGLGGYGGGYGGYGGQGRWLGEESDEETLEEVDVEVRELGKKKHGHGGGYGGYQPIYAVQPSKKGYGMGGYGGYGMGGYGGYGGQGRWLAEEEIVASEVIEASDVSADERELGKKKHGYGGGYGYHQPIVVAMPQKKQPVMPVKKQPVMPMKKGGYGGYGGYGMGGYGGRGRWLAEEEIEASAVDEESAERNLKQMPHTKMAPQKIVRPVQKKQPTYTPMKAPRPVQKKTVRTVTKKAAPPPLKKQPVQQYKKAARPVYYQRYHGNKGF